MPERTARHRRAILVESLQPAAQAFGNAVVRLTQQVFSRDTLHVALIMAVIVTAAGLQMRVVYAPNSEGQFERAPFGMEYEVLEDLQVRSMLSEEERQRLISDVLCTKDVDAISSHVLQDVLSRAQAPVKWCAVHELKKEWDRVLLDQLPFEAVRAEDGNAYDAVVADALKKIQFLLKLYDVKDGDDVLIKVSGDGRVSGKRRSYLLLTITILRHGEDYSTSGCHTIALGRGKETRGNTKLLAADLNRVLSTMKMGGVELLGGGRVHPRFVLCADMKFLLSVLGLNSVSGEYSCPWCLAHAGARSDLRVGWHDALRGKAPHFGVGCCKNPAHVSCAAGRRRAGAAGTPLFPSGLRCPAHGVQEPPIFSVFDPEDVVLDVLHANLRIMDHLMDHLIAYAELCDRGNPACPVQRAVSAAARKAFVTWVPTARSDPKRNNARVWTMLDGHDKLLLLRFIDLAPIFAAGARSSYAFPEWHQAYALQFTRIWMGWCLLFEYLDWDGQDTDKKPRINSVDEYRAHCYVWLCDILAVWGKKAIVPYMHALLYHVPGMLEKWGNIKQFSTTAQEALNARQTKTGFFSGTSSESAKNILQAEHRLLYARVNKLLPQRRAYSRRLTNAERGIEKSARAQLSMDVVVPKVAAKGPPRRALGFQLTADHRIVISDMSLAELLPDLAVGFGSAEAALVLATLRVRGVFPPLLDSPPPSLTRNRRGRATPCSLPAAGPPTAEVLVL